MLSKIKIGSINLERMKTVKGSINLEQRIYIIGMFVAKREESFKKIANEKGSFLFD